MLEGLYHYTFVSLHQSDVDWKENKVQVMIIDEDSVLGMMKHSNVVWIKSVRIPYGDYWRVRQGKERIFGRYTHRIDRYPKDFHHQSRRNKGD